MRKSLGVFFPVGCTLYLIIVTPSSSDGYTRSVSEMLTWMCDKPESGAGQNVQELLTLRSSQ